MKLARLVLVMFAPAVIVACGGSPDLTCSEVMTYQLSTETDRVRVPDGLDGLDPLREMPLPDASPRPPRPENSPCLDLPPMIQVQK